MQEVIEAIMDGVAASRVEGRVDALEAQRKRRCKRKLERLAEPPPLCTRRWPTLYRQKVDRARRALEHEESRTSRRERSAASSTPSS